jgi:5-methylcytosine-specific restriction enzyme A
MPTRPPTHKPRALPRRDDRPSAAKRGYGWSWLKLRRMVLARNPLCQHPGCTEVATDVDHILRREWGGEDSLENLQALCHYHHSQKTAREQQEWNRSR